MIKLTPTHLIFEGEHENLFNIGDLISIQYTQEKELITPYIGLSSCFNDEKGYKFSKQKSILFKGKNNNFLSNFGIEFNTEPYENYYKLIPLKKKDEFNIEEYKLPNIEEEILDIDHFDINIINNKL